MLQLLLRQQYRDLRQRGVELPDFADVEFRSYSQNGEDGILPYIFSLAIGVGRLADGHHWASDLLVGGVVGFAVGKAIAERQLRRQDAPVAAGGANLARTPWQVPVMQWSVVF